LHGDRLVRAIAVGAVFACDLILNRRRLSFRLGGLVDECAHVAVAAAALPPGPARDPDWTAGYLAATVTIDLDHLPQLVRPEKGVRARSRPPAHTLLTPAALVALSRLTTGPTRAALRGAATGVAVHLGRDLGTGPGVALLSPLHRHVFRLPYSALLAVLGAAAWTLPAADRSVHEREDRGMVCQGL
jgi:inner membrane protein